MARDTKKIDAKGRFFIPTKHKDEMGEELVVTNSLDTGYLSVYTAEDFRKVSVTAPACDRQIYGKGLDGYLEAMDFLAGVNQ